MQTIKVTDKKAKRRKYRHLKKVKRSLAIKVKPVDRYIGGQTAYITVGSNKHFVLRSMHFPTTLHYYICDCGNGASPCSHVIAVKRFRGESI